MDGKAQRSVTFVELPRANAGMGVLIVNFTRHRGCKWLLSLSLLFNGNGFCRALSKSIRRRHLKDGENLRRSRNGAGPRLQRHWE